MRREVASPISFSARPSLPQPRLYFDGAIHAGSHSRSDSPKCLAQSELSRRDLQASNGAHSLAAIRHSYNDLPGYQKSTKKEGRVWFRNAAPGLDR
jgi:hypothetical protein